MSFSVEVTGLQNTIQALIQTDQKVGTNTRKAVEVTSRHVKDDAKKGAKEILGPYVRHQASTYQYEIKVPSKGVYEGLIGPVKGWKQAAIPLEYGTPHTAAKPVLEPALAGNLEDFLKGVNMAVGEAI